MCPKNEVIEDKKRERESDKRKKNTSTDQRQI